MWRTLSRKMKDSGIEWIGDIPEDWEKIKFKYVFNYQKGKKPILYNEQKESMYPYISMDIQRNEINKYQFAKGDEGVLGEQGDICVLWDGANAGEFYKLRIQGIISSTSAILLRDSFNPIVNKDFLFYYLKFYESELKFNSIGMGIPHVDSLKLRNDILLLPSLREQKEIVDILNNKTKKIEKLISKTNYSIKELKKYKQSLITEAVTKGLDPNVEMKDSGIEWIGDSPKSWMIIKLNQLFSIKKNIANETGYDVLSVTQRGLRVRDITRNEGQMAADYSKYQIVEKDDFVMNHMDLLTGWVDITKQQGVTSPDYRVFFNKQKEMVLNDYYLYIFQTAYTNKIFYGLGQGVSNVGRWRLQTDKFLNFYVPLPSLEEQHQIVSYLDQKTSRIDKLIEDKTKVIEELENYKKSLIYEYVTGKKEV